MPRDHSLLDWQVAAEYLGTSPRHLQRLWAERRIAGCKIGRKVRFTQRDLDDYIERNRVEALR
jgi:excisionase family DNA binding protein